MKSDTKHIWRIIRTNKSERTTWEQILLDEWCYRCHVPIRIIIFPIAVLIKIYKWTYDN